MLFIILIKSITLLLNTKYEYERMGQVLEIISTPVLLAEILNIAILIFSIFALSEVCRN